ncbi:PLP-dependent aminotransferase family protein [Pseudorhodoferax sp. Leaf265]|uniref:MocR-like pyridoxine biosynthesis transcription factor PdxR n=1 Tax=Pseudorhodoferax sp. Leaf265 TaxID=1736315 RepID=UPI000A4A30DE|nr:PLP-dependent aminotransferase family protein [Pseudorhodoferax sp. Leaf265]
MADPKVPLALALDRAAPTALTEQIAAGLRSAIEQGRLAPGARLPSWRDLASQLGVARGTVRAAYETLIDAGLVQALGAAGTHVARRVPVRPQDDLPATAAPSPLPGLVRGNGVFQMGVPAQDGIPAKLWSRLFVRAARTAAGAAPDYPDPRGEPALRTQIAAMLAVARGLACSPAQVYVTGGHAASVALAVRALGLAGQAWTEEPGYPLTRKLLATLGLDTVAVPVDAQGLDVAAGQALAPQAALAVVTPGQQAPLGVALALARRRALLDWAVRQQAWVLEDDYLGELQLQGRAAPALGADVGAARVLHVGTFSKTISPALRLGFLVVPADQVARFDAATALHGSAPAPLVQQAVAELLRGGHHLRHLRRMKRLYQQRRDALLACLRAAGITHRAAGLAVLLQLPPGRADVALVRAARALGLSPAPLSPWYARPAPEHNGLLLGVTNLRVEEAAAHWARLQSLIDADL